MARAYDESGSLRFGRRESARVIVALLFSVLLHLVAYGSYYAGYKLGWWQKLSIPEWLHQVKKPFDLQAQLGHQSEPDPTIFVDVSHADADAPSRTRYYADKNSRAANPDTANANVPKITGMQTDVIKTEDVPRPSPRAQAPAQESTPKETPKPDSAPQLNKLEPSMPPPSPMPTETLEAPNTPGDLSPRPKPGASPTRPRTLKQALAQQDQIPGQKMQQAGGVARPAMWSSLDVKATPFGDYDRAIIEAVSQRWYDLLDSRRFAEDRNGKVILRFKLKPDGTIIEMETVENNVGELLGYLCHESIEEAAPFGKWPPDMLRMIGTNSREITFTFYYY